jgi:hypothetical protein
VGEQVAEPLLRAGAHLDHLVVRPDDHHGGTQRREGRAEGGEPAQDRGPYADRHRLGQRRQELDVTLVEPLFRLAAEHREAAPALAAVPQHDPELVAVAEVRSHELVEPRRVRRGRGRGHGRHGPVRELDEGRRLGGAVLHQPPLVVLGVLVPPQVAELQGAGEQQRARIDRGEARRDVRDGARHRGE